MIPYALEGMPLVRRPVATVALIVVRVLVLALHVAPARGPLAVLLAPFVYRDAWELVVVSALVGLAAASVENRWGPLALAVLDLGGGLLTVAVLPLAMRGEPGVLAAAPGAAAVVAGAFSVLFVDARMKVGFLSWLGAGRWRMPAWAAAPFMLVAQVLAPAGTWTLLPVVAGLGLGAGVGFFARRAGVDTQLRTRAAGGRDEAEIAQDAAMREATRLPGGTADRPIEVSSASVVDTRARSLPCPSCGETTSAVEHHRAVERDGRLLREVHTRCRRCGAERVVWLVVGPGPQ